MRSSYRSPGGLVVEQCLLAARSPAWVESCPCHLTGTENMAGDYIRPEVVHVAQSHQFPLEVLQDHKQSVFLSSLA